MIEGCIRKNFRFLYFSETHKTYTLWAKITACPTRYRNRHYIIIIIVIIIIIIRYGCLLSQAFPSRYFSRTSGDPHRSRFKLHTAVLSVLCDVPTTAVFCGESIESFPGTASKFFRKLLVTIPVVPIITGITVHFRLHIRCISIHKLLYFNFFFRFLLHNISVYRVFPRLSVCMFSFFLFLIIISGLFAVTSLPVCTYYYYYHQQQQQQLTVITVAYPK